MRNHLCIELATTVQRFAALKHSIDEEYGATSLIGLQAEVVQTELTKLKSEIERGKAPLAQRKAQ